MNPNGYPAGRNDKKSRLVSSRSSQNLARLVQNTIHVDFPMACRDLGELVFHGQVAKVGRQAKAGGDARVQAALARFLAVHELAT